GAPPAAAPGSNAASAGERPSPYPLAYPVSDPLRSVVRTLREHLALTAQHMQALGCEYETSLRLFAVLRDWAEPRQAELDALRREYAAARSACLNLESTRLAVSAGLNDRPTLSPEGRTRLAALLDSQAAGIEPAWARYQAAEAALDEALAPLAEQVAAVFEPEMCRRWEAARRGAGAGLPHDVWFVPSLSADQQEALRRGQPAAAVLNNEQWHAARHSSDWYRACAAEVREAEMAFFFGRPRASPPSATPAPSAPAGGQKPAQCPYHQVTPPEPAHRDDE
ncbi:MAG TPA: hypothetical protein PKC49_08465, partial [Phycisphaerae bacterium]|nr:hypothetical protein [Phycisphaerae bacterium]